MCKFYQSLTTRRVDYKKIPIFDIATIIAAGSVGYATTKGLEIEESKLATFVLYLPTALAISVTPAIRGFEIAAFKIAKNVAKRVFDMNEECYRQKREMIDCLEKRAKEEGYIVPTINTTGVTALETYLAYKTGQFIGYLI